MPASARLYGKFLEHMLNGRINFPNDAIHVLLLSDAYTPNIDGHAYVSDVRSAEISGTGYTANGQALGSKSAAYTAANAWPTAWAASTAYEVGDVVRPTTGNGFLYRCVVSGTSGATQPAWPTVVGQTVTDGGVTWACEGRGALTFDAADVSWPSATFTARYAVLADMTPATDATRPLIGLVDFGQNMSPVNGTFAIQWHASGIGALFIK